MKCRGGLGTDNARSTPSPRGRTVRPLRSGGIRSAGNSPATSPALSRQVISNVKAKTLKPDSSVNVSHETSLVDVTTPTDNPAAAAPVNSDVCPCGSTDSTDWKIDCSKCKRYWHLKCLTMGGITAEAINKMVDYQCPHCYVPPIPYPNNSSNICFTCKNTENLRNLGLWQEIQHLSERMEQFRKLDAQISKIDLTGLMERTAIISDFDTHLQHLLFNDAKLKDYQDSVKSIETEVQTLSRTLSSQPPVVTDTSGNADNIAKLEKLCEKISVDLQEVLHPDPQERRSPPIAHTSPAKVQHAPPQLVHTEKPITESMGNFLEPQLLEPLQKFFLNFFLILFFETFF